MPKKSQINEYSDYSVHPRKGRVVLSLLPFVLWASGCWHYERTLYSHWPLKMGPVFLSIYLVRPLPPLTMSDPSMHGSYYPQGC